MSRKSILNLAIKNIFDNSQKKELTYDELIAEIENSDKISKEFDGHSITFNSWVKKELEETEKFGFLAFDFKNQEYFIDNRCKDIFEIEKINSTPFSVFRRILSLVNNKSNLILEFKKARNQKLKISKEIKLIFSNKNDVKYVSIVGKFNYDFEDKPVNFFCSVSDETKGKRNEKYQKLINSVAEDAKHAIVITEAEPLDNPGPRILYVNDAFTKLTGYSLEESLGQSPRFLQGEETDAYALKQLKQNLKQWNACKAELINYKKNGEKFWVELDIVPVKRPDGYVTHWVSIQRDITEMKLSQQKLHDKEIQYLELIDESIDLIQSIGDNGEILFVNKIWKKTLEYTDEDLVDLTIFDIIAADCIPKCIEEFEEIKKGNQQLNVRTKFKSKSGKTIHLFGKSIPRIVDGKIRGAQGFFKDISREVEIEHEKSELQYTLNKVKDVAEIGEFKFNFTNKSLFVSDKIHEILGIQKNTLFKTENWIDLIHSEDIDFIKNHFDSCKKNRALFEAEFRVYHNLTNEILWLDCKAEFQLSNDNNLLSFNGSIKNISNTKKLKSYIEDTRKSVDFIFSSLNQVLFKIDEKNQKIIEVSDNCSVIFGYTSEDFLNDYQLIFKIIHPDDFQNLENSIKKLHQGLPFKSEFRITELSGKIRNVELNAKPLLNEVNELDSIILIVNDISNKQLKDKELRNALNQLDNYKKAIDASAIVSITDASGMIIFTNSKFCEISQYTEEECYLKSHNIINSNYHSKEFFTELWKTISSGNIWKGEIKNKAKDGSFYWVDSTIIPFLKDGKPYQYISIRYDISEKKKMSLNIENQKNFYEGILNEIPADVVVFDKHHNYLFINPNGVKDKTVREFLIGKNDYDYCTYRNKDFSIADERRALFLKTIESKKGISFEEKIIEKEGHFTYKLRKFYPTFDQNNECQYVIGFGMDITDLKNQEFLISESLKEKEVLLGEIHHRVKNNLAVIDGLIELKKIHIHDIGNLETLSEVQTRIKIIALVHEKLYNSEQFSNINLKDYLTELTNYYVNIFNKTDGDTVNFKIECQNLNFDISKSITFGLLLNELITNSLKYAIIKHKVTIYISLFLDEENIVFNYKDEGNGVSEEIKNGKEIGFGYKLIKTFLKQLKGELIYTDSKHFDITVKFNKNSILK